MLSQVLPVHILALSNGHEGRSRVLFSCMRAKLHPRRVAVADFCRVFLSRIVAKYNIFLDFPRRYAPMIIGSVLAEPLWWNAEECTGAQKNRRFQLDYCSLTPTPSCLGAAGGLGEGGGERRNCWRVGAVTRRIACEQGRMWSSQFCPDGKIGWDCFGQPFPSRKIG